jgi:sigma-B regulation protein RsbU (phosphoserine phosphatase)
VLDVEQRTLRLASAGHPPPLLIRRGHVAELPLSNAPLLFWEELGPVTCHDQTLEPGDRVVFYTDGITERHAADDSLFEMPRLMNALADGSRFEIAAMIEHLVHELDAFGSGAEPDDDQTVLAIGVA